MSSDKSKYKPLVVWAWLSSLYLSLTLKSPKNMHSAPVRVTAHRISSLQEDLPREGSV